MTERNKAYFNLLEENKNVHFSDKILQKDTKVDRSSWKKKAVLQNPSITELTDRISPYVRAVKLGEHYNNGGLVSLRNDFDTSTITQLILQHLHYSGLRNSCEALEKSSGIKHIENDLEESRLVTILRSAVKDSEAIWNRTIADRNKYIAKCISESSIDGNTSIFQVCFSQTKKKDEKKTLAIQEIKGQAQQNMEEALLDVGLLEEDPFLNFGEDTNIWEEPIDQDTNVIWTDMKEGDALTAIKAASLNRLCLMLTPEETNNTMKYQNTFLLTYQSFCTPDQLLQKLIQRYQVPKDNLTDEEWDNMKNSIQMRVCSTIKSWIKESFEDFNDKTIRGLTAFIENTVRLGGRSAIASNLEQLLRTKVNQRGLQEEKTIKHNFTDVAPEPRVPMKTIFSHTLTLMEIDEAEIARQLTLIEFELYSSIRPSELLNLAWSKPKYKHKSKNVLKAIDFFNKISNWVVLTILGAEKLRDRGRVYTKFIKIAEECFEEYQNYNSTMAILAGLAHAAIYRLKYTKEEVPQKQEQKLTEIQAALSSGSAYKNYRELLALANPPTIPYLGVYLTDLTFIEEGNPNYIKGLINFSKRKLIYNVISAIKTYQQTPYNLQPVYQIKSILLKDSGTSMDDEAIYRLSLAREPRGKVPT